MKFLLIIVFCSSVFAQSFEQNVVNRLQKQFPEYEKIELQLQKKFSSEEKAKIDDSREINLLRGTVVIPIIKTKGKKTSTSIVLAKAKLYKKVLIAINDIDRKENVNKSEFEQKVVDVTRLNGNPVTKDFLLADHRTKSFVKKGEILFEERLEKIPLISVGDKISAEVINGNVLVSTNVLARQQGCKGDVIECISSGNKIIKAKIVDANKVIVE